MKSINTKLILGNVLVVIFCVLLISIPVVIIQYNNQKETTISTAEMTVTQGYTRINLFLQEPITMVESAYHYLSTNEFEQNLVENLFEHILRNKNTYSELYFGSVLPYKDGGFFYANDRWTPPADYDQTTRAWFRAGHQATNGNFSISDPYLDSVTNSMVAALASGITKGTRFEGVVALDVQLKDLNDIVSPIKISKSGKSFLLDKNGNYVTNSDSSKLMNSNFFTEYNLTNLKSQITENAVYFTDNAGKGQYFAARMISKESGWIFVTIGPKSELYSVVFKNIFTIIILAVISLVVSAIVAAFLSRSIVAPVLTVNKTINGIAN